MFETIASSLRSATGAVRRQRRSRRSKNKSNAPHTASECKADRGVQTDSDECACVAVESHHQILPDTESGAAVEAWKKRAHEAEHHARSVEARLAVANRRLDAERASFNQQLEQAQQAARQAQASQAEDRTNRPQAALAEPGRELRRAQDELREAVALLDTKSAELRDAQAYLSRHDDVADAEVLRLVEGINSRIFQAAASITDAFQPRYGGQKDVLAWQEVASRVQHTLSDDLLHALHSIDHFDDSLMQTLLQAVMVFYAGQLCDTWDFDAIGPHQVLQKVYCSIRQKERQSVAGRWRALSRTYVKTFLENDTGLEASANDVLMGRITDILLICGIAGAPQELRREVEDSYADAIREIVHKSLEFQRITGEGIISRDLLVVDTKPGEPFNPSCMVDEWADPKKARRRVEPRPVLCTTQLGLVREEKKVIGGEEAIARVVLLKPKVVLTSFLEELLNASSS
ncbi:hypothetical protein GSI_03373 [Ganoderma sinense ZZ0214-1]|uniref:Uncharacterized protein n=1 Tax=Ganoderma sinense ZZ0214-1 TaxID=1077348 RepID=A0A2G8SLF8_9APHY|nr:hypothetical protein GSI_03373 [Ganoderma sinense ZZ0214-1]